MNIGKSFSKTNEKTVTIIHREMLTVCTVCSACIVLTVPVTFCPFCGTFSLDIAIFTVLLFIPV